jgi:hypothetical protein
MHNIIIIRNCGRKCYRVFHTTVTISIINLMLQTYVKSSILKVTLSLHAVRSHHKNLRCSRGPVEMRAHLIRRKWRTF